MKLFIRCFFLAALLFNFSCVADGVPRGVRNNNPGNIVKTQIDWKGEVSCADSRFECFSRPKWGIRAMALILTSYHDKHGINNVADVLRRWMPSHENNTEKWIEHVRHNCISDSRSPVPLDYDGGRNRPSLDVASIIQEIIYIENGEIPYSREEIENAIPNGDHHSLRFFCN